MKTVLRSSGMFNQGMSAKKLAQGVLGLVMVAQALHGSASEAPVGQGGGQWKGVLRIVLTVNCLWRGLGDLCLGCWLWRRIDELADEVGGGLVDIVVVVP